MTPPPVPATGYAVLGLLSFGESLSGYDLKRWADHSLRYFFWSPAQSAVYTELRRLQDLGFVRAVGATEGPRGRQRYAITAEGRRALTRWVGGSDTPTIVVKDHALLKLWLGHTTDAATVEAVAASELDAAEVRLDEVRYSAEKAAGTDLGHVALVERCCERLAAARVDALRELVHGLASLHQANT